MVINKQAGHSQSPAIIKNQNIFKMKKRKISETTLETLLLILLVPAMAVEAFVISALIVQGSIWGQWVLELSIAALGILTFCIFMCKLNWVYIFEKMGYEVTQ